MSVGPPTQSAISISTGFAADLAPVLHAIQQAGATTLETISVALNRRGIRAARGNSQPMWQD
jgi:hypothetical protein